MTKRSLQIVIAILGIFSVAVGMYLRLQNLGRFPFSIDEYYFYSAVKLTLANGLPEFICGGYYSRGILLQYLTVPFIYFFENQELAARLPTLIFSALSFPAVYLIGRNTHSPLAGILALFLFAFSIWQIEFARFARMYAPFQMIFLWQVYLFLRPNHPKRGTNILLTSFLAFVATLIYAGGIFCVALAFFSVALHQRSFKISEYIPASIAAGLAVVTTITPFRHLNAVNPLPAESYFQNTALTVSHSATNNLPIDLPSFLSFTNHSTPMLSLLFLYTIVAACFIFNVINNIHFSFITKILICTTIFSLLVHQFLLALCLFTICLLITETWGDFYKTIPRKIPLFFVICTILWIFACIINFAISQETHSTSKLATAIFNNFFSYPDIYFDIFRQWQKPMPIHSTLSILTISLFTLLCIFGSFKHSINKRYLLSILIFLLLLVALINTPYNTSRYSYFLSPIIQIIFAICIASLSLQLTNKIASLLIIILSTSTLMYLSEDYRLGHTLKIDSYAINHRQTYDKPYTEHLYPRYDYTSIANFMNNNAKPNDLIIITTPVIEHYLNPDLTSEYFITPENPEFINHSTCNGARETWSRLPLIHSYESLGKKLDKEDITKWVILHGERGNPFSTPKLEEMKKNLQPYFVFENPDNSLRVYRLKNQ